MFCENHNCADQVKAKIEFWVSKDAMDIDKIGPAVIQQLYDKNFITTAVDLYRLTMQDFMQLDLVKEKSAFNMYTAIQNSKNNSLKRLLTAFAIRNIGKETAEILANEFGNLENLMNAEVEVLSKINGIGPVMANDIYAFFHNEQNIRMIEQLKELGVNPKEAETALSDKLKGKTFVLTGTLQNMTRDEASQIIKQFGGKTSSSVSKNTSYVLAGENPGSKLDKAEKLGVIILSEEEFQDMIK